MTTTTICTHWGDRWVHLGIDGEARTCAGFIVATGGWVGVDTESDVTIYIEAHPLVLAPFASQYALVAIDDLSSNVGGRQQLFNRLQ